MPLTQPGRRAVAPIIPFFMREVLLEVVVTHPLLRRCKQVFPRLCFLKRPIRHATLDVEHRLNVVLVGSAFLDFLLADPKLLTDSSRLMFAATGMTLSRMMLDKGG